METLITGIPIQALPLSLFPIEITVHETSERHENRVGCDTASRLHVEYDAKRTSKICRIKAAAASGTGKVAS